MFAIAHLNLAAGKQSSDCAASFRVGDRLVVAVADGAGRTAHGREAARAAIELRQSRKPLLGDGAVAVPFVLEGPLEGTLVVASDGLFAYADESSVIAACAASSVELVATGLLGGVRLPSGALRDDVAVFVVRRLRSSA